MKNYVTFNQRNFIKIGESRLIKVDTIDATLFDWIRTFMLSNKAMKKIISNELYIWVSYQAIREDNPLCNINTNDSVSRRLNKLVDLGILKKYLSKEDGNKTFFCITSFAYTYLLEDRELSTQESEALPTQESDNSKLEDSKLNNTSIDYDEYLILWNEFAAKNKKSKMVKLTNTRKKQIANRLKDYKNFLEIFKYILLKAEKTNFLLEGDFFDFDWITKNDNNIAKILEGKYDNRKSQEVVL